MSEREQHIARMKAQLDQWDGEIEKLQAKAREADNKMQVQDQIAELQKQRGEADAMIAELEQAGDDTWQEMKSGRETAWNNVSNAFHSAKKGTVT